MTNERDRRREFSSRVQALRFDQPVVDSWIIDRLMAHPDWDKNTMGGACQIMKRRSPYRGTDFCLCSELPDGTIVDMLQWTVALKSFHGQSLRGVEYASVIKNARRAIEDQMSPLRRRGCDVDHCQTDFIELLRGYFRSCGRELRDVTKDEMKRHRSTWANYHSEFATLQVVPVSTHRELTRARKEATTKPPTFPLSHVLESV